LSSRKYLIAFGILTVLLLADQAIKIYIKTHFPLGEVVRWTNWCSIHFTENPGMAFGFTFGAVYGKIALTTFRILASIFGLYYLIKIIKSQYPLGYIIAVVLILTGALGNIVDSICYGLWFDRGTVYNADFNTYLGYVGIAAFVSGYAPIMQGCVVDMFYFPLFKGTFPNWMPLWGGEAFEFFRPVFNLADACITCGVIILLLFNKRFQNAIEGLKKPAPATTDVDLNS